MTVSDTIDSGEGYMIEKLPKGMTRSCMLDVAELLNEHARGDIGQLDSEGAVRVFNAIVGHLRPGDELPNGLVVVPKEPTERMLARGVGLTDFILPKEIGEGHDAYCKEMALAWRVMLDNADDMAPLRKRPSASRPEGEQG